MIFRIVVTATLLWAPNARAGILWQTRSDHAIEVAELIPPSRFSDGTVVHLCESFLRTHRGESVSHYLIVTDSADAFSTLRGRGTTDWNFHAWRAAYLASSSALPATAEMTQIGRRASVRIRRANGTIMEHVIQRGSPLEITYQGRVAKILSVTFTRTVEAPAASPYTIELFVQSSIPWTIGLAEAYTRKVRAQTRIPWLVVSIEDGWWFATSSDYPIYNRFLPHRPPPSFDEFKAHARFFCAGIGDQICQQSGPALP
jgi:hypothetical protein